VEVVAGQGNKTYTSPLKQLVELGRTSLSDQECEHSMTAL